MAVHARSKLKERSSKEQRQQRQPPSIPSYSSGDATEERENRARHRDKGDSRQRHGSDSAHLSRAWNNQCHQMKHKGFFLDLGFSTTDHLKSWSILLFGVVVGVLHWGHISTLFENDRHFSHLSTLEREMAFRTEMGLYYSYFKTMTEAPSFYSGLHQIMNDNITEYPKVINTLQRFNLYPEMILASWFRVYTQTMDYLGYKTKLCWTVNRGDELSPVESCEGKSHALRDLQISTSAKGSGAKNPPNGRLEHSACGELVYHALQLVAFAALAVLIMRLKLFLSPHMCIMASLLCSKQLFGWISTRVHQSVFVFIIVGLMSVQGYSNLQSQWNIKGEFSNLPQEELLEWIHSNTNPGAVFAGAMPTMASVKLSTGRPIVNHPHYEDTDLRARTKKVYSMYSRKPAKEVKNTLLRMGVDFFILEDTWCTRRTKPGCSLPEIWDIEDPENAGKVPLCSMMGKESRPHFLTVFNNGIYKVLSVRGNKKQ
eukprot:XP_017952705.1 PREDICTED: probable C-mannosyltransferase DPY19L1 [Xenopus tropicalis]